MWEVENKSMEGDKRFGVKPISCSYISNLNHLLNYPVLIPITLI